MKVLGLVIAGADAELLLRDERLEHIRRLMDIGSYGRLVPEGGAVDLGQAAAHAGGRIHLLGASPDHPELAGDAPRTPERLAYVRCDATFGQLRARLDPGDWNYLQAYDGGLELLLGAVPAGDDRDAPAPRAARNYLLHVDERLGELLELLDGDTAVLLLAPPASRPDRASADGAFVLAAQGLQLGGEVQGAHLPDLAPTLLELLGYAPPATLPGRSLVAGLASQADYSADEEELIRERLSGLGYIE